MTRGTKTLIALVGAFTAGAATDSWLRVYGPPQPAESIGLTERHEPLESREPFEPRLRVPIDGIDLESLKGGFAEERAGHAHEAVDILAPRNTPVHAVGDGTIAKLFTSKAGGLTIYQFDPSQRFCYYYAHLERYAAGLNDGNRVAQGQVIGYVGTSGNAPPDTPHLHFAIFELGPDKHWWEGKAIDPYEVFKDQNSG
jgi:peptidoglycan LD-endopeptidase LytH